MKLLLSKTREKELNKVKQILVKSVADEKSVDSLYDYIFSSELCYIYLRLMQLYTMLP